MSYEGNDDQPEQGQGVGSRLRHLTRLAVDSTRSYFRKLAAGERALKHWPDREREALAIMNRDDAKREEINRRGIYGGTVTNAPAAFAQQALVSERAAMELRCEARVLPTLDGEVPYEALAGLVELEPEYFRQRRSPGWTLFDLKQNWKYQPLNDVDPTTAVIIDDQRNIRAIVTLEEYTVPDRHLDIRVLETPEPYTGNID